MFRRLRVRTRRRKDQKVDGWLAWDSVNKRWRVAVSDVQYCGGEVDVAIYAIGDLNVLLLHLASAGIACVYLRRDEVWLGGINVNKSAGSALVQAMQRAYEKYDGSQIVWKLAADIR